MSDDIPTVESYTLAEWLAKELAAAREALRSRIAVAESEALAAARRENATLREALDQYADPKHWAILRDEFRHPSAVWIGPGADQRVPDAVGIARAALAASPAAEEPQS